MIGVSPNTGQERRIECRGLQFSNKVRVRSIEAYGYPALQRRLSESGLSDSEIQAVVQDRQPATHRGCLSSGHALGVQLKIQRRALIRLRCVQRAVQH